MLTLRYARCLSLLLVGVFLLPLLLSGCQGILPARQRPAAEVKPVKQNLPQTPVLISNNLPATWTPTPPGKAAASEPTRTRTPTATATFNSPQTIAAQRTTVNAITCKKHADAWPVKVAPSWKAHWCEVTGMGGYYYEYQLLYPGDWQVNTFGDIYPNMYFYTNEKGVELRLYQVYNYNTRKYTGTLEDAPSAAAFCDGDDKCLMVVDPNEKIIKQEKRAVGNYETLILDSKDGQLNVRRYFFFVPFRYSRPKSNRLFFFKLYTPETVSDDNYQELQQKIEEMIVSLKAN